MAKPLSDRDRARLAKLLNQMTSDMSDAGNAVHHVLALVKQYGLEHQWEQVLAGPDAGDLAERNKKALDLLTRSLEQSKDTISCLEMHVLAAERELKDALRIASYQRAEIKKLKLERTIRRNKAQADMAAQVETLQAELTTINANRTTDHSYEAKIASLKAELAKLRPAPDPWSERIVAWIDAAKIDRFTTQQCLLEALGIPLDAHTTGHARRLARVMGCLDAWRQTNNLLLNGQRVRGWTCRPDY
jgi:hypothetical protein